MKTITRRPVHRDRPCYTALAAIAALLAAAPTSIAWTPPTYEMVVIHADTTSLIGIRLLPPVRVGGIIGAVAGTVITDNSIDFGAALPPSGRYVIEMRSGPAAGRVIDIVAAAGNTLTLAENGGVTTGTTYAVRAMLKLSQIWLGYEVPPELTRVADFNPDSGDLILIPDGQGRFNQYYYSSNPGYMGYVNAGTGMPEDPYIHETDALLYRRQGASFSILIVGEVKATSSSATALPLTRRFSPICSMDPRATLANLGLAATVQPGWQEDADIVWSQDPLTGQMNRYHYVGEDWGTSGWFKVDSFDGIDQGGTLVSSGLIIRRRGPLPHTVVLQAPQGY